MLNKLEDIVDVIEQRLCKDHSKIPDPIGRAHIKITSTLLIGAVITIPSLYIYSNISDQPSVRTILDIAGYGMGLSYLAGLFWSAKDIINLYK